MNPPSTKETRTANLNRIQQERKQQTLAKVEQTLERMVKQGMKINFSALAKEANVSESYLYKYPEIKLKIAEIRNQQSSMPRPRNPETASAKSNQVIVSRLKDRIKKLEAEVTGLRNINEGLAGRVYRVSELEAMVERYQQTIEDLQNRLKDAYPEKNIVKVTPISSNKKAEVTDNIKSELNKLNILLNTTLIKKIKAADEETVIAAIEALKDQSQQGDIKNPGGWLARAIEEEWTVSQSLQQQEKSHYQEGFEHWYAEAIAIGFVLDIPANYLGLDGYNQPIVKINRPNTFGAPYTTMNWKDAREEMKSF